MGVDRQQPIFSLSGSLQGFDSYGSGTIPNESWNSAYVCDATNSTTDVFGREKSALGSNVTGKTEGFSNPAITNNKFDSRPSNFPPNTNSQCYAASPNISKSLAHTQHLKPSNQVLFFIYRYQIRYLCHICINNMQSSLCCY